MTAKKSVPSQIFAWLVRQARAEWGRDQSLRLLIATNGLTILIAVILGWSPFDLMALYWVQSVIIGLSYAARMMALERFTTTGLTMNGKGVDTTPKAKRQVVGFFLFHFGCFHAVYFVVLFSSSGGRAFFSTGLALCALTFIVNHYFSYRENRQADAAGTTNIGTLMFTPYLRVVPMHLCIIFAAAGGLIGLLIFGVMKTIADALMHIVEHKILSGSKKKLESNLPLEAELPLQES